MTIDQIVEKALSDYAEACTNDDALDASAELRNAARMLVAEVRELRRANAALRAFMLTSTYDGERP